MCYQREFPELGLCYHHLFLPIVLAAALPPCMRNAGRKTWGFWVLNAAELLWHKMCIWKVLKESRNCFQQGISMTVDKGPGCARAPSFQCQQWGQSSLVFSLTGGWELLFSTRRRNHLLADTFSFPLSPLTSNPTPVLAFLVFELYFLLPSSCKNKEGAEADRWGTFAISGLGGTGGEHKPHSSRI